VRVLGGQKEGDNKEGEEVFCSGQGRDTEGKVLMKEKSKKKGQ